MYDYFIHAKRCIQNWSDWKKKILGEEVAESGAIGSVFAKALEKYNEGALKYGNFEPSTDTRDLIAEAEDEILDAINYLAMFLVKLEELKK